MAHKRIRSFNTKQTYPEQNLDNDLSQGVVARGTMVFLRGQVSQDLDSRESLHVGDAARQTEKTMQNINLLLEEAGSCLDHICRIVVYLTDIRYREAVYQEMGRWLKGATPDCDGIWQLQNDLAKSSAPTSAPLRIAEDTCTAARSAALANFAGEG